MDEDDEKEDNQVLEIDKQLQQRPSSRDYRRDDNMAEQHGEAEYNLNAATYSNTCTDCSDLKRQRDETKKDEVEVQ